MATFFGEVLPVHSRAVDDDDDDDETDCVDFCPAVIKWNPDIKGLCEDIQSEKSLACSSMLIAVGPAASGFVHAYLIDNESEAIAAICTGFTDDDSKLFIPQSPTDKTCRLYRSRQSPKQFTCICNSVVSPEQAFSWTSQLFDHIDLSEAQVAVLSSSVTSEYRTDVPSSELTVPFVKALRTQAFTGSPFCPYLEQPNIVNGLPAQILTYLHIRKLKGILYHCYTDTIFLDSRTIKAFKPILTTAPFKDSVKVNPKADEQLKHIVHLHTTSNTLYL
ncbi:proteasome assembly chaperone 1-like [Liolophura sinensis]|uniref:proteasome assembly chaperone 1-like n=1 Tax=Liolophura sinensis TaxID=3198878 RepID=UPI0031595F0E